MITHPAKTPKPGRKNIPYLDKLYIHLTEGCNLACRHCWLAPGFDTDGTHYPTLSIALFEKAISEAKPLGLSGVKLTGGEPLLHPRFSEILDIIEKEGIYLSIETNGILVSSQLARRIAKFPNASASVSIDGATAKTHEWIRGVKGSFEKAKEAVRNLTASGIPTQIITTIMRANAHETEAVVEMAAELGASSIKFNIVQPIARAEVLHRNAQTLNVRETIALGRKVEAELAPHTKLPLFFGYPLAFRSLSVLANGCGAETCGIQGILGIIPTGHYALCGIGHHVPELVFGKIGQTALAEIWKENKILKEIRAGLPDHLRGICSDCLMKYRCLGSCIAHNYYRTHDLWSPFWFCEMAMEEGLFPASRLATDPSKIS
jgi:SynChlorMet cassette radical SAM/SPASM protein ScmF